MIDLSCPLELPQPKPRIKLVYRTTGTMWSCNGYLGRTPEVAYHRWAYFEKEGPRC